MKSTLFLAIALVCSVAFNYCRKSAAVTNSSELIAGNHGGGSQEPSNIFDPTGLVSPSAHGRLDTIQKGFSFTEGPAVDKWGNVFFTDQPNDKIYRWDASSEQITLFLQGTGRSNGMEFDKQGNLIACADMHGELWKIRPNGTHEVLVTNYNGKLLNGPNDV